MVLAKFRAVALAAQAVVRIKSSKWFEMPMPIHLACLDFCHPDSTTPVALSTSHRRSLLPFLSSTPSTNMTIHLYAEHLVNIRTLSIQALLSTVSNQQTQATLSADGSSLTLSHEGEVASIKLPITVPGGHNDATLTIPAAPTKDLSFRVSLQEKPGASGLLTNGSHEYSHVIPWSATALSPDTEVACKTCNAIIVRRGRVKVWKDLPSENWAEMMDFWHCHRPDVPHDHDKSTPQKGYSASSRLALESGVGMVDPVDFVLAAEDCENLAVGAASSILMLCPLSASHHPCKCTGTKNRSFRAARSVSWENRDTNVQDQKTYSDVRVSLHGWPVG